MVILIKKRICVFASSANELDEKYYMLAKELGACIACEGYDFVYGGSHRGLMYACASSAKEHGADIYAVIPKKLADLGMANFEDCKKLYVTKGMRERKAKMDFLSDATITLPGGFGSLEELSEMIVQKQLGYNNKAIVILNSFGYYDNLIRFFEDIIREKFAYCAAKELYYVAKSPNDAVLYIKNYEQKEIVSKFI